MTRKDFYYRQGGARPFLTCVYLAWVGREHHVNPHEIYYCITCGLMNYPMEAVGFFRKLERLVELATGRPWLSPHMMFHFCFDPQSRFGVQFLTPLYVCFDESVDHRRASPQGRWQMVERHQGRNNRMKQISTSALSFAVLVVEFDDGLTNPCGHGCP